MTANEMITILSGMKNKDKELGINCLEGDDFKTIIKIIDENKSDMDIVKAIIQYEVNCSDGYLNGIYFVRNTAGDEMTTLYDGPDIQLDVCYGYGYFEVFGLEETEQKELKEWFDNI